MKVTVEPQEKAKEIKYPCLMQHKNDSKRIILFIEFGKGTVISDGSVYGGHIGYYSNEWTMELFTPYNGKITLEND